jgi:hypothetical protein
MDMLKRALFLVLFLALLSGCGFTGGNEPAKDGLEATAPAPSATSQTVLSTSSSTVTSTPTRPIPSSTPDTRLSPDDWQEWPVIPAAISGRALEIYQHGNRSGNNPRAFSKIGDCESTPSWFLGAFDGRPDGYSLGEYGYLQSTIEYFQGSYSRTSLAAGRGFTTANELTALWADPKNCNTNETPLACEIRVNRPAFAFVMLGSNDIYHQDTFEPNMRKILDTLMEDGIVPILVTKADNLEGDHAINATIVRLAYEYDLPLWNFWLAVQPLPSHGLQTDGSHLTTDTPFFDDPVKMRSAWPWRNLGALQMLDTVRKAVSSQP